MNVRPAGREACNCASPYNSILERLDAMEAEILAVQATANSAMGVANAQAGAAASSASAAAASATAAGNAAISAAADASDALTQATASAGSADDAADSAADALTALQTIEGTIASVLASDIGGKVDKLTTAGFYLYMHNGSTQGEVQPVVAPTAATIPIRDSNGRMQAADPASGATDKTLVTANWVSQTGDSAPNNLSHRTGNETVNGIKTHTSFIKGCATKILFHTYGLLQNDVCKVAEVKNPVSSSQQFKFKLRGWGTTTYGEIDIIVAMKYDGVGAVMTHTMGTSGFISQMSNCIIATEDTANRSISIFYKNPSNLLSSVVTFELTFAGNDAYYGENTAWVNVGSSAVVPEPTSNLLTVVAI